MKGPIAATIDEYIAGFPEDVQKLLKKIRTTIKKAAPKSEETIKYAIPTFMDQGGNLVHFAAYKNHIGFYPAPRALEKFKKELSRFDGSKGTLKIPFETPLPLDLIGRIVKFRVKENEEKVKSRTKKKTVSR